MTDSDSEASLCDADTTPGKWTSERIRLLIRLRLEMESQFRSGRSRHLLWPQIYNKLKSAAPSMTETLKNVQKKFNNLMLTYKRINSSPRNINQSRWEFFEDFHAILSQFGDAPAENEPTNVRYIQVDKVDDDSVSFSSDDGGKCMFAHYVKSAVDKHRDESHQGVDGGPSKYKNVVAYKRKSPAKPTLTYSIQPANGIKTERLAVDAESDTETKKRKLTETTAVISGKAQKKMKTTASNSTDDTSSWFEEFVKMNERREQQRYEQHEQLLELERKRIEIEMKNGQTLRELVDLVRKFVNKSN
ncbi:uncharacterized protein LOC119083021 isoform X1 [Bradysia coprophila]|uniref:uncharacterized protein LOC119083021 isoform X1 n=1 Tax=Bradysia coprophila TaxID=38358 RepID=UPI00187DC1AD|nr:uncharacterized protein LOC119083021 isoform X1 [Bradysia coprophila]